MVKQIVLTMTFHKKWLLRLTTFSACVGLLLTGWRGSPLLAAATFGQITVSSQKVVVIYMNETTVVGLFEATAASGPNGQIQGKATLQLPAYTVEIVFTSVDKILYEAGNPIGLVLSGRAILWREGQSQTFAATVTVRGGTTTSVPECLIWSIPGNPVLDGLSFDAEGMLRFRE